MIDGTRIYGSKNIVSGAGDMAMNAALAGYDADLNDAYGLIAMSKTPEELQSNLQTYFENTLNAQGLTADDLSRALIYVQLMNDSFQISAVPDTEIYKTEVLKQQILEHMKYRGPVMLVENGILDKVDQFKNMESEKKAVQAQMDFEADISDLTQLFEDLNEMIDEENDIMYISLGGYDGIDEKLRNIYEGYRQITYKTVANKRVKSCTETISGDDYELIKRHNHLAEEISSMTGEEKDAGFFEQVLEIKKIRNSIKDPEDIYKDLDKKDDEYKEKKAAVDSYRSNSSIVTQKAQLWRDVAHKITKEKQRETELAIGACEDALTDCNNMMGQLEQIKEKMEDLKGKYEDWQKKVEKIEDSSVNKSEYQKSLAEYKEFFHDGQFVDGFCRKVEQNKLFYQAVKDIFEALSFTGYPVREILSVTVYMGEAEGYIDGVNDNADLRANHFIERYYGAEKLDMAMLDGCLHENLTPENDELVKRIKEYWAKKGKEDEEENEKKGDEQEANLLTAVESYKTLILSDDIAKKNVSEMMGGELPSNWLNMAHAEDVGGNTDIDVSGNTKNKEDRKEITKNTSASMDKGSTSANGLSTLAGSLEHTMEDAYITEYILDMFSYYTVNKNGEKQEDGTYQTDEAPLSLNHISLQDNALYRAEVEYILWGDPDSRDNVRNTKALIFALQLTSNSIYAFAHLRNEAMRWASAMVGVTPWQPVVAAALLSVDAIARSANDLNRMMNGEGVAVYKNKESWPHLFTYKSGEEKKMLALTYRDYLWLFVMIHIMNDGKQVNLLARTADCVEMNMTKEGSFMNGSLKKKSTMVRIDADVRTNTFFFQRISMVDADMPDLPETVFQFHYSGIQGY